MVTDLNILCYVFNTVPTTHKHDGHVRGFPGYIWTAKCTLKVVDSQKNPYAANSGSTSSPYKKQVSVCTVTLKELRVHPWGRGIYKRVLAFYLVESFQMENKNSRNWRNQQLFPSICVNTFRFLFCIYEYQNNL